MPCRAAVRFCCCCSCRHGLWRRGRRPTKSRSMTPRSPSPAISRSRCTTISRPTADATALSPARPFPTTAGTARWRRPTACSTGGNSACICRSIRFRRDVQFDGGKVRSVFVVPDAAHRTFFYGVNFELSINNKHWDDHSPSLEIPADPGAASWRVGSDLESRSSIPASTASATRSSPRPNGSPTIFPVSIRRGDGALRQLRPCSGHGPAQSLVSGAVRGGRLQA